MTSALLLLGFLVGLVWRSRFVDAVIRNDHRPRLLPDVQPHPCKGFDGRPLRGCTTTYPHDHFLG